MRINNVVRVTSSNISRNIAFARAPKKGKEEQEYTQTIQKAFDYLGVENRALIVHGTSFPAANKSHDMKTGTPTGANEFVDFMKLHGFNGVQLGPGGKLNQGDTSPYTSSVFEKNPLFINPEKLKDKKYGAILSDEDIEKITSPSKKEGENYDNTDFKEANKRVNEVFSVAHSNFKKKLSEGDKDAQELDKEFQAFRKDNDAWLDNYSVLNVLGKKYETDYYPYWSIEDRNLIRDYKNNDNDAIARYNQIKQDNKDEIEQYQFSQFLLDKQLKEDKVERGDFKYISDLEVGASSLDELAFQDAFLKDYKIGCEQGGVKNSPQLWGISMPDPNKLFNEDGSLGKSGKFLKAKIKNNLSGAQNVRIDHAMGLVNPYLYRPDSVQMRQEKDNQGKDVEVPIKEKLKADYLSNLNIDPNRNYQKVISKIVIPTMKEMHVEPKDVVWEDLGHDPTGVFNRVYREENHLPGISCLIWTKKEDAPKDNWAYIGCHDNKPGRKMIEDNDNNSRDNWKAGYLASRLRCDPYKQPELNALKTKIKSSPKELWKAKTAELFCSTKNVQMSFMDFFGINKSFNTPGTTGGDNWKLRLNSDYKDTYYKSLEQEDGWAVNMPETLSTAVQAKLDENVSKKHFSWEEETKKVAPLLNDLNKWSNVLKEKEH